MGLANDDLDRRLQFARETARAAGRITLNLFGSRGLAVDRKADDSPVTVADREAEEYVCRKIAEVYPEDGWIGEEHGTREGSSGYRWIIDPIDGTKSFICDVPLYATLIGLEYESRPVLGVIELPALGESVFARVGGGAWHVAGEQPPQPARVSATSQLNEAVFVTSEAKSFGERGAEDAYRRLERACWITRTWGDAYGYYLVATGRATVMVDPIMSVWDAAAILPILEEAGGRFTDWSGNATVHGGEGVGTNGHIHEDVLKLLRG